ncbi:MAG: hypothetical protein J6L76_03885 [Clostridia bacterium]|nr:hypothetical protein [Clostridia bacterium]
MDEMVAILAVIIGGGFGFLLLVGFVLWIRDFCRELQYVNSEIDRTEGEERQYWIWQRRELWLSLLPFYR